MDNICVDCGEKVRPRQHIIPCTYCGHVTHRCCSDRLQMDSIQCGRFKRGEIGIQFRCKTCAVESGLSYSGEVLLLKPSSMNIQVSTSFIILNAFENIYKIISIVTLYFFIYQIKIFAGYWR